MSYDGLHGVPKISDINHDIIYKAGRTNELPIVSAEMDRATITDNV